MRTVFLTKTFALAILIIVKLMYSSLANAGPWVDAKDERTRHHILVLLDAKVFSFPATTWPLMWNDLKIGLDGVDATRLSQNQLWSYRYIKHALRRAENGSDEEKRIRLGGQHIAITDFASDSREKSEIVGSFGLLIENFAFRLQGSYVDNPTDRETHRLDGSYLAGTWGNWVLGYGAINRWWGPGWHTSLSYSHNARPAAGIFLNRKVSSPSELPVLKLIGPWQLHLAVNELKYSESEELANLAAARFVARPLSFLEIGLSTQRYFDYQQFSRRRNESEGEIRRESFLAQMYPTSIINSGAELQEDYSERTNSLDARINFGIFGLSNALYAQRAQTQFEAETSEADGGTSPCCEISESRLVGAESSWTLWGVNTRANLEYVDNMVDGRKTAVEQFATPTQSHMGRALNTSLPFAEKTASAGADHYFSQGPQLSWRVGQYREFDQVDEEDKLLPADKKTFVHGFVKWPVSDVVLFEFGGQYYENGVNFESFSASSGGYFGLHFVF